MLAKLREKWAETVNYGICDTLQVRGESTEKMLERIQQSFLRRRDVPTEQDKKKFGKLCRIGSLRGDAWES